MNKSELMKRLNALAAEGDAIAAKDMTGDESKRLADITTEMADIRKQLETLTAFGEQRATVTEIDETKAVPTAGKAPRMGVTPNVETVEVDTKAMQALGIDESPLMKTCESVYRNAFRAHMVGRADVADLKVLSDTLRECKTLVEGIGEDGGYLVPIDQLQEIIAQKSPAASFMGQVRTINTMSKTVTLPRDSSPVTDRIQWVGETGQAADDQPDIEQISFQVHEGRVTMEFSDSLMDDAPLMETYALNWLGNALTYGLEVAGLTGNGAGKPMGALTQSGGVNGFGETNVGNPVTATGLMDLVAAVPEQYRQGAVFLCNDTTTWGALMKLRDADNALIGWLDSVDGRGLANARASRLLGYPAIFSAAMPAIGSGNKIGLFGNLNEGYAMIRRLAVTVVRWAPTKAETSRGVVGYTAKLRYGGGVLAPWACRVAVQS